MEFADCFTGIFAAFSAINGYEHIGGEGAFSVFYASGGLYLFNILVFKAEGGNELKIEELVLIEVAVAGFG